MQGTARSDANIESKVTPAERTVSKVQHCTVELAQRDPMVLKAHEWKARIM